MSFPITIFYNRCIALVETSKSKAGERYYFRYIDIFSFKVKMFECFVNTLTTQCANDSREARDWCVTYHKANDTHHTFGLDFQSEPQ